jgi:putative ABC transport system ATP-binding protein
MPRTRWRKWSRKRATWPKAWPVLLELRGLAKGYGGEPVFQGVDLDVAAGEFVAILGESGVGKSTLLNCIAGLDTLDAGTVRIDGTEISALDDTRKALFRREHLGFVFQAFHVLPHLTLHQNVALPLLLNGMSRHRANEMLDAVGLQGRADDYPHQLSGGQLQRVAIARALVHRPGLVLADEPTGNLDPDTAHSILMLLRNEIKASGACTIMVTHSHAAAEMADHTLILTRSGLQVAKSVNRVAQEK